MERRALPAGPRAEIPVAGEFRRDRSYTNWRPHGKGDWLLIMTCGGAGYLTSATAEGPAQPGEVTLYEPGEQQDYRTDPRAGRWHLLWVHFLPRPSWLPWLGWPRATHGVRSLHLGRGEARDCLVAALRRVIRMSQRRLPNASEFAFNALEEALLWTQVAASRDPWMRTDLRVQRAMDYLAANLRQPFRMDVLARHCGISASRLAHLFKAEAGISAQQFSERQRMWHAGQLLQRTGLGVAEVAAEVGFDDPFYFSNRFRRYAGKSPSQFRARG